jgi:hypothetical protein
VLAYNFQVKKGKVCGLRTGRVVRDLVAGKFVNGFCVQRVLFERPLTHHELYYCSPGTAVPIKRLCLESQPMYNIVGTRRERERVCQVSSLMAM